MTTHNENSLNFNMLDLLEKYKLKNIIRYNTRTRIKDENVAEHSFFTALIALELCKRLKLDESVTASVVIKALLHDLPEMELNDVTYDVKMKLDLYPLFKQYEDKYFISNFAEYAPLMNDESDSLINNVVKYADALSVLQYTYNELELGNESMSEIVTSTVARLDKLKSKLKSQINTEGGF